MEWTELSFAVKKSYAEQAEAIASMVTDYGIMTEDYSDLEQTVDEMAYGAAYISEELLAKDRNICIVHVYLPPEEDPQEAAGFIRERLDALGAEYSFSQSKTEEEEWSSAWKKFYHPFRIGTRILVCPSWETCDPGPDDVVLTLDPGAAFGTGEHETTAMCLEHLDRIIKTGDRVLDMGCGSGILFIAALLLGADRALAVDISDVAVRTAGENARINQIGNDRYEVVVGNVTADPEFAERIGTGYDVITANIVADVLIAQAKLYYKALRDGGTLIVSGIIGERANEVEKKLESTGFLTVRRDELKNWVSLVMTK